MKLEKIIIILGPPGSGKGTQSKLLVEKLHYGFFGMGDTLRQYAKKDTDLGREIKSYIERGIIIPDEASKQVVLQSWQAHLDEPGLILEGYPRTSGQVEVLEEFMAQHRITDVKVLSIEVTKDRLLKRLAMRKTCPHCQASYKPGQPEYDSEICSVCGHQIAVRVDDADAEYVAKRFAEYEAKTAKTLEYFAARSQLVRINGDQSDDPDESIRLVHEEIVRRLGL